MTDEGRAVFAESTATLTRFVDEFEDWSRRYTAEMDNLAKRANAALSLHEQGELLKSWAPIMARIDDIAGEAFS